MVNLYRDPKSENVFSMIASSIVSQGSREIIKDNEHVIKTLRDRVSELESSLEEVKDRTLSTSSTSKVTFSEVDTLIIEQDVQRSSVSGSSSAVIVEVQGDSTDKEEADQFKGQAQSTSSASMLCDLNEESTENDLSVNGSANNSTT